MYKSEKTLYYKVEGSDNGNFILRQYSDPELTKPMQGHLLGDSEFLTASGVRGIGQAVKVDKTKKADGASGTVEITFTPYLTGGEL